MKFVFALLMVCSQAWAFPEMVRHGYVNCISCHVSPSGGGVLTQYGRELSKEILSADAKEGEQQFLYNTVKTPEWFMGGGDFRGIGTYKDTPTTTDARIFLMQADIEAAINYKKLYVDGSVGYQPPPPSRPTQSKLVTHTHYLNVRPTDETSLRAGKFRAAYGINTPDHVIATKRGLGWDEGTETYNAEAAWIGDNVNMYATGIFGRPDDKTLKREKGGAFTTSAALDTKNKVGVSYFYGKNDEDNRHVAGPFAILGFTPKFFMLSEIDFQGAHAGATPTAGRKWGVVDYVRLDYEFVQGFHGMLTQEATKLDFSNTLSLTKAYGLGVQYFPRPHFELNMMWQIQTMASIAGYTDFAWLMLHFYP